MKLKIVSVSRRTDVPAFYGEWFMNRVRAGWCAVPNPFNTKQVSRVEFDPRDTAIVFWTRWAAPFLKHIDELEQLGYRFYFQYTLVNYPKVLDPKSPSLDKAITTFHRLAERIGPEKVIWRYDPILFSQATDIDFHLENFTHIAERLSGASKQVVISIVDPYEKAANRLNSLGKDHPDFQFRPFDEAIDGFLFEKLVVVAKTYSMGIQSCAEEIDLRPFGIEPGKCIDDGLIDQLFGIDVNNKKDKGQRKACGCVESREIGMYDSCLFGCSYCYATKSFTAADKNHSSHDPQSESLIGNYTSRPVEKKPEQGDLF